MEAHQIVLLIVDGNGGKLRGKTLLQKRGYFISKSLKLDLGYKAHYYGPYSPVVEDGIAQAKALGFLEERTLGFGVADSVGFEVRRYDYSLTEDGKEIIKGLEARFSKDVKKIRDALQSLKAAGDSGDYVSLSIAAKSLHILSEKGGIMGLSEIKKAASGLGWSISEDEIDKASDFLVQLGVVQKDKGRK